MSKQDSEIGAVQPTDAAAYQHAIERGRHVLEQENSKAAAAREIYSILAAEDREVILQAFIEGADVTPKSSATYFYNITRKLRRKKADDQ